MQQRAIDATAAGSKKSRRSTTKAAIGSVTSDPIRQKSLDWFHISNIIETYFDRLLERGPRVPTKTKETTEQVVRYADMLTAMGTEPRLRIMRLLLSAHPDGMVVGDIQSELDIAASTLSHHLDKLKNEELVTVRRDGAFLYYRANTQALQELLSFLYSECCTRNKAIRPEAIIRMCK